MRRALAVLTAAAATVVLAACTSAGGGTDRPPSARDTRSPTATATATPSPTATPTATAAPDPLAGLTLAQRVGQLFMVGTPAGAASAETIALIANQHIGGVFLNGRSAIGTAATAQLVAQLKAADHDGFPLLVSTDQEGGRVQRLAGPGFTQIPSALTQSGLAPATLRTDAAGWASQLRAAGVDMNLAPVTDVVASAQQAAVNPPIGQLQREYGYGAASVSSHAGAFAQGMLSAGVVPVVKHFPGLGAVTGNTDYVAGVTDSTTTDASPSVRAFGDLISDGAPAVMISNAIYARIAPGVPGPFALQLVTGLLRTQLGFDGVVMTDDVSATAQLDAWAPADRAVRSIQAGVDIVLVSAAPELAAQMIAAVVAKAQSDPAFAARVDAACRRVLSLKRRYLPAG